MEIKLQMLRFKNSARFKNCRYNMHPFDSTGSSKFIFKILFS